MIIVLVGLMGSGKSTIGKALAKQLNFNFLEVSDTVKSILNDTHRSSMVQESLQKKQEDPMWLAEPIRRQLSDQKHWVVSGVREIVVLDTIRDLEQPVYVIHLECSDQNRLKRCKDKHKTIEDLHKADAVDRNLGLDEVLNSADIILNTNGTKKQTVSDLLLIAETFSGFRK